MSIDQQRSRAALKQRIRNYFHSYLEVDTPVLVPCGGEEPYLRFFTTKFNPIGAPSRSFELRSSPELHMKRLFAPTGVNMYQLGPVFRDGAEYSPVHHPEFTMLEWYSANQSFAEAIEFTLGLIAHCGSSSSVTSASVQELWSEYVAQPLTDIVQDADFSNRFFHVWLNQIEPHFKKYDLLVVYDYPAPMAALAAIEQGKAKRFEIFARGVELCNGFLEELDVEANLKRHEEHQRLRAHENLPPLPKDHLFFEALRKIEAPQSCGVAMGFERLLAFLNGSDQPFFPGREDW